MKLLDYERQKKSRLRTTANGSKENTNHAHYSMATVGGKGGQKIDTVQ